MDSYTAGKWEIRLRQGQMMGSESLDKLSSELGVKIPAVVYDNTFLAICHKEKSIGFSITANKALELTSFEKRAQVFTQGEAITLESISFLPGDLKVAHAKHWVGRTVPIGATFSEDSSQQEIAKVFQSGCDWTYTTPYKGTWTNDRNLAFCKTDEEIPLHRLGMDNPILWGGEVMLYEDELDDCGQCKFYVRIRAMADCFFALVRFYLRVDHVVVRIFDTRIFHSYEENSVIREFQAREATYDELRAGGFNISPQWSIDPRQSDLVYGHLKIVHSFKDKISY
jgi:type 2A phosphatase activator TIP41